MKIFIHFIVVLFVSFVLSCDDKPSHDKPDQKKDTTNPEQGKESKHDMSSMPGMDHTQTNHSEMLQLTARQQMLAGIKTDTIRMKDFRQYLTVLGEVALDESTVTIISAKVKGRIDKLYLRNPGDEIRNGQLLFEIYSETLYAEQLDLLQLIQTAQTENFVEAARNKLLLHGLTANQISGIEKQKLASPTIKFYSGETGFLTSILVREGQYVETGEILFEVASLNVVRINAQIYPDEIALFNTATGYEVETSASPGKNFLATRVFDNPSIEPNSKIQFARLRVINADHVLRPGMMTTIKTISNAETLLMISKSALILENGMSYVWVREKDGMFSRRTIQVGKENKYEIEVISGLNTGERIVTNGSYLINSEFILQKGANAMGGMKM